MTNWYGSTSTKQQIDSLLEKKPKLSELLAVNQFCQQLKSFNSKLLDYMSNNPELIRQAIVYLTVAPSLTDSQDRKYKLPLLSVEMVETESIKFDLNTSGRISIRCSSANFMHIIYLGIKIFSPWISSPTPTPPPHPHSTNIRTSNILFERQDIPCTMAFTFNIFNFNKHISGLFQSSFCTLAVISKYIFR